VASRWARLRTRGLWGGDALLYCQCWNTNVVDAAGASVVDLSPLLLHHHGGAHARHACRQPRCVLAPRSSLHTPRSTPRPPPPPQLSRSESPCFLWDATSCHEAAPATRRGQLGTGQEGTRIRRIPVRGRWLSGDAHSQLGMSLRGHATRRINSSIILPERVGLRGAYWGVAQRKGDVGGAGRMAFWVLPL
jgi:hypothetical protein